MLTILLFLLLIFLLFTAVVRGYLSETERPCATWKLGATELLVQWYPTIQQIFLTPYYVLAPSDTKVITWLLCFRTFQLYILYSLILYKELTMLACLPNTRDAKTKSIYMHQPPHRGLITYNHAPFQIFPGWHLPSMVWFLNILEALIRLEGASLLPVNWDKAAQVHPTLPYGSGPAFWDWALSQSQKEVMTLHSPGGGIDVYSCQCVQEQLCLGTKAVSTTTQKEVTIHRN